MAISGRTVSRSKTVDDGLGVGEPWRLKLREEENRKLKQLIADLGRGTHWLLPLEVARTKREAGRRDNAERRPRTSLGGLTPAK